MIYQAFCIYDKMANNYGTPQFYVNDGVAKRAFRQFIQGVSKDDKADYELYYVSSFEIESGVVTAPEKPTLICKGSDFE